jgi:dUTP pyrophosphatase
MSYYRLELQPTEQGAQYYKNETLSNYNAGYDLFVAVPGATSYDKPVTLLDLGARARMVRCDANGEQEVHYWLAPRSSIWKSGAMMANSMGVIDSTYRGVLMGSITSVNSASPIVQIEAGVRLFQILAPDMGWIKEVKIVQSLPTTVRGEGGFGSTGR